MLAALAVAVACTGGSLPPSTPPDQLRPAIRCLINDARATDGLKPLRGSRTVHVAAQAHADDMMARDYFAHERPGWTFQDRLDLAGWWGGIAGETLETGCGGLATPSEAATALLASPPHREILLSSQFRRMAIAVVPFMVNSGDCPDPGTWVLDLVGPA